MLDGTSRLIYISPTAPALGLFFYLEIVMEEPMAFYTTVDPQTGLPALTTMLYRVCDQDAAKFEEACRLVELLINQAVKEAK
jgi:hypothetical protein